MKERLSNMELMGPEWQSEKAAGEGQIPFLQFTSSAALGRHLTSKAIVSNV